MADDPIYIAGFRAGLEAAASYVAGRASMANELQLNFDADALAKAAQGLRALVGKEGEDGKA